MIRIASRIARLRIALLERTIDIVSQKSGLPRDVVQAISAYGPERYIEWVVSMWLKFDMTRKPNEWRVEDLNSMHLRSLFSKIGRFVELSKYPEFQKVAKSRRGNSVNLRDIFKWDTNQISEAFVDYRYYLDEKEKKARTKNIVDNNIGGQVVLTTTDSEGNQWSLVKIDASDPGAVELACAYGDLGGWCTKDPEVTEGYLQDSGSLIIFLKNGSRHAQAHIESGMGLGEVKLTSNQSPSRQHREYLTGLLEEAGLLSKTYQLQEEYRARLNMFMGEHRDWVNGYLVGAVQRDLHTNVGDAFLRILHPLLDRNRGGLASARLERLADDVESFYRKGTASDTLSIAAISFLEQFLQLSDFSDTKGNLELREGIKHVAMVGSDDKMTHRAMTFFNREVYPSLGPRLDHYKDIMNMASRDATERTTWAHRVANMVYDPSKYKRSQVEAEFSSLPKLIADRGPELEDIKQFLLAGAQPG